MTEQEAKAIISSYGAPANIAQHIEAIRVALRGLGKRGYDEILAVLGRNNGKIRQSDNTGRR